jgi:large subunit ribosomal protein L35
MFAGASGRGNARSLGTAMPKLKTNRGAAKRFRKTATGKYKMKHAFLRHQLTHKPRKRKRHLRAPGIVPATDAHRLERLLPYL